MMRGWREAELRQLGDEAYMAERDKAMTGQAFVVYIKMNEWGDPELAGVHRSQAGAEKRCNDHRKLLGGDPIQWHEGSSFRWGTSAHCKIDIGKPKPLIDTYYYTIEPFPLGD